MKKTILFFLGVCCMFQLHAQMVMPSFHPVNYSDSYSKTITSIEILAVGAGGGGGGADQANYGGGGGGGGAVIATINARNINANSFSISIGGGGGGGAPCSVGQGAGAAGTNGGGIGGKAGTGGCSGGGGGGGGWSGVSSGNTYFVVAGGGAGGGGAYEGLANDRVAPGGGSQPAGANGTSMTGGTGVQFSTDGGGGGGGGGGFYGGAGQDPNSSTYDYKGSGGANFAHTYYTTNYTLYEGNGSSGLAVNGNAGGAISIPSAANFNYLNNKGAGGRGGLINSTASENGVDGIVIIRYKGPQIATGGEVSFVNGYTIHTFTSSGSFSFKLLPVKGAIAHYMANQFVVGNTPTTWTDQSGNGYHATMSSVSIVNNATLNNNVVIQGTTASNITFPVFANWTNNTKYTLFVVQRYTSGINIKRILTDNTNNNWLTGHWQGFVGVAHHNNWITSYPNGMNNLSTTDWVMFTDQADVARCNTINVITNTPGNPSGFSQLAINGVGWSGEKSDFEIAELIVYPKVLNNREIYLVEDYLSNKYGIAGTNDGLMLNLDATHQKSFDGNGTVWNDLASSNEISWSSSTAPIFKIDKNVSCFSTANSNTTKWALLSSGYNNLRTGNGAYSVMAIFKPNNLEVGMIVSMGPATSTCDGSIIHPIGIGPGGKFAGGACGGLGTWQLTTGVTPTTDKFWTITTTFTGGTNGTETVYVDGVFDKSATMTTNTPVNSINKFTVGWLRDNEADLNMNANVAVILYYNKALSATEVTALYNKYKLKLGLP